MRLPLCNVMFPPLCADHLIPAIRLAELCEGLDESRYLLQRKRVLSEMSTNTIQDAYHSEARWMLRELMEAHPHDMPPLADTVTLLIDAFAFRYELDSRAQAWPRLGISKSRGRQLAGRSRDRFDWPIYYTLLVASCWEGTHG